MMSRGGQMSPCDHIDSASLYALGLLDDAEARVLEQHLKSCPICEAEVRETGDLGVELAGTIPPSPPPAGLRQRVLAEAVLPRGLVALVRGAQMNWRPTPYNGITVARLYEDAARGELASLVRMMPGARYPSHRHAGLEHCYVLEGDLIFEDHTLTAGDYSAGSPERDHTSATTRHGCLLFLVNNAADQIRAITPRLSGWAQGGSVIRNASATTGGTSTAT